MHHQMRWIMEPDVKSIRLSSFSNAQDTRKHLKPELDSSLTAISGN